MLRSLSLTLLLTVSVLVCRTGYSQQSNANLVDGMVLGPGSTSQKQSLNTDQGVNSKKDYSVGTITELNDGLRYTYVNSLRVLEVTVADPLLKIEFDGNKQRAADRGTQVSTLRAFGVPSEIERFGRRIYTIALPNAGAINLVQGVTEISSQYVRMESLRGEKENDYVWDMRLALSNIDSATLQAILIQNASPTRSSDWLNIVNLFSDAKRYLEARDILSKAINKFPELENNRSQLKQFDQLFANQMFDAAQKAQDAGQYEFATYILESINKSGIETELKVQRKLETMSTEAKETAEVLRWIQEDIAKLPDPAAKAEFESLLPEITRYLRPDTALRFADYRRRRGDANLKPEQLAAIAISGWIYGSGVGEDNTSVVSSGVKARRIIKEYLESPVKNDQLIEQLSQLESGSARLVASLVANMPPPVSTPDEASVQELVRSTTDPTEDPKPVTVPGRYIIDVPLRGAMQGKTVRYMVQLPPEYNPFRRYPCVLTLPSEYSNAEEQILWWSGPFAPNSPGKRCLGEASKSGYIVVSPAWAEPKQPSYNYTENEHAMVLAPLRDAMRRFSIDSDHVFVSGHFMGADAAWDVALAHPDLWAGSIMIGAGASKYIIQYWENAYYVPSYFVMGELDGRSSSNFKVWDNLLGRKQIDCIIANYRGRGLDHFQEELPRIMDWMSLPSRTRNFVPKGFTAITSRAGDRFFWWFETQQLLPDKLVHPLLYAAGVEYKVESVLSKEANSIQMRKAPAKNYTIWLSPEMVDFSRTIIVENKRLEPKPSVRTLLEDVRARADRQHPFWMKVEMPK